MADKEILTLKDVKKFYKARSAKISFFKTMPPVKALDGVSLSIQESSITALVGESGSGKTTLGKVLCRLEEPTSGEVLFNGQNIYAMSKKTQHSMTKQIQMIFQDPYESLDPRFTVGMTVMEPLVAHGEKNRTQLEARVKAVLKSVGLNPSERYFDKKPSELSGGERQRVSIARAMVLQPSLLIADEPVSMLDVSVRAEVLNLLVHIKDTFKTSIILITHDLAVARYMAERLIIFYKGKIMEEGPTQEILSHPRHPYTLLLLSASPRIMPGRSRQRAIMQKEIRQSHGCAFAPRCTIAREDCFTQEPVPRKKEKMHFCACPYFDS